MIAAVLAARCSGSASAGTFLTEITAFSSDSNGFFSGNIGTVDYWHTGGGGPSGTADLWVALGGINGPLLNGPNDASAGVNIALVDGDQTFTLLGDTGRPIDFHGLNLFFNGNNANPNISAFVATALSPPPPNSPFFADSSQTYGSDIFLVPGAGTLSFVDGPKLITLKRFFWADPSVFQSDRVGFVDVNPDGRLESIGQITINVRDNPAVPEPSSLLVFAGLGAAMSVGIGYRRRSGLRIGVRPGPP
jgi:hypothetical protein